jgi:hypothetical protein
MQKTASPGGFFRLHLVEHPQSRLTGGCFLPPPQSYAF